MLSNILKLVCVVNKHFRKILFNCLIKLLINHFVCILIDSVMAAALSLTFGRGGALIGNLVFGFLIDLNCVIPIVLFASMLFGKLLLLVFFM